MIVHKIVIYLFDICTFFAGERSKASCKARIKNRYIFTQMALHKATIGLFFTVE
ncbi:hypothetical protein ykris0001_27710 [Yersinia kristensenii ATCC 33638]|nr:hypothetical protein ykris0001_27710 [Yersinia kristensenii ATCC 33638]